MELRPLNGLTLPLTELGIIAATGITSIAKLIVMLRDDDDTRLPSAARAALLEMAAQIEMLSARNEALDAKIVMAVKADNTPRRLTRIPGVGPIIAATVRATIQDPAAFPTGRGLAAWLGITPKAHLHAGSHSSVETARMGRRLPAPRARDDAGIVN